MKNYLLFVFVFFLSNNGLFAQEALTCKDFREGTFVIRSIDDSRPETFVIRKGNQQTEIMEINGERLEAVIDLVWINDCTYTVVFNLDDGAPAGVDSEEDMKRVITVDMKSIEENCAYFEARGSTEDGVFVVPGLICKEETL